MTSPAMPAESGVPAASVNPGIPGIPAESPPVLEVTDLQVTFPARGSADLRAVRGLSYAVRAGEVLGIVGESGSGKSVSSLAVMGLLPAKARVTGSVRLHGSELLARGDRTAAAVRGRVISMIFQDPLSALTPVFTVGDQIAEAIRIHTPTSRARAAARAVELLDLVGIPSPRRRADAFPHEFSGGMRQRVMIAMAVANDPDVIIADEPTTALDVTVQAQVLEVLRAARRETGAAMVLITHDLGVVAGFADRVMVMYAGRPVETGSVDDLYYRARMPYTMGLLASVPRMVAAPDRIPLVPIPGAPPSPARLPRGCAFAPRCPLADDDCRVAEPALEPADASGHQVACVRAAEIRQRGLTASHIFSGRTLDAADPGDADPGDAGSNDAGAHDVVSGNAGPGEPADESACDDRPVVLAVDRLVKHHPLARGAVFRRRVGSVAAVDGVSLDIRAGETLALVGESGSGKTTTLLEILRLEVPSRGRITVLGKDVSRLDAAQRHALRRDVQVVFQDPTSALDPRLPVADTLAEPLRAHGTARHLIEPRVHELLRLVGLGIEHAARFPHSLSGGQRQRIGIARALALYPRLVILDEPVSALDVSIQAGVINLLDELRVRLGLAYLFVAHDLAVVRHLADRVAVMHLGRIVETGEVTRIYRTPAHPYTQALLSAIPVPDPRVERARHRIVLRGEPPSAARPPSGCRFRTRCQRLPRLIESERRKCVEESPVLRRIAADHQVACHFAPWAAADDQPEADRRRTERQAASGERGAGQAPKGAW